MITLRQTLIFVLLTGLVPTVTPVAAQRQAKSQTAAPSDAQVRELEEKIKSLQQQLDELNSAKGAASRRLMQQNWQGMQDYMGWMHDRWGMGYPWMMEGNRPGNRMCRCPMMGGCGASSGWSLPSGLDPNQYTQKMRSYMLRMQEQMNKIGQTTDPQERRRLLREHWESMYQDMQTMRGMGWMWDGYMMGPGMMGGRPLPSAKALPEPSSQGAKLVGTYCVQCHAAPQPDLHTAAEWSSVTRQMQSLMNSGIEGIKAPTEEEMKTILSYMQKNAP